MLRPSAEFVSTLDRAMGMLNDFRRKLTISDDASAAAASIGLRPVDIREAIDWYAPSCAIAQCAPVTAEALVVQLVTSMLAPNLMTADYAGTFADIDQRLVEFLSSCMGLTRPATGLSVYSGTTALFHAVRASIREADGKAGGLGSRVILASALGHMSLEKIGELVGQGRATSVVRLTPDELGRLARSDRNAHRLKGHVAAIVGTFGSSELGDMDDFSILCQIKENLRAEGHTAKLCVDAVLSWPMWAGCHSIEGRDSSAAGDHSLATLGADVRRTLDGDYFAIDFHKWLGCPLGSAFLLLSQTEDLNHFGPIAKGTGAGLHHLASAPHEYLIESTRSVAGPISALVNLLQLGVDGLARVALDAVVVTRRIAAESHRAGWRTFPANPPGPIVCIGTGQPAARPMVERLHDLLRAKGLQGTVREIVDVHGHPYPVLRLCMVNPGVTLRQAQDAIASFESTSAWFGIDS